MKNPSSQFYSNKMKEIKSERDKLNSLQRKLKEQYANFQSLMKRIGIENATLASGRKYSEGKETPILGDDEEFNQKMKGMIYCGYFNNSTEEIFPIINEWIRNRTLKESVYNVIMENDPESICYLIDFSGHGSRPLKSEDVEKIGI
ncbi:MAG: hypothetical protein KKF50_03825 [Nanoarchaeota archaeon]|nr:hypothetical protein [Nanoarchaeota archaeon]